LSRAGAKHWYFLVYFEEQMAFDLFKDNGGPSQNAFIESFVFRISALFAVNFKLIVGDTREQLALELFYVGPEDGPMRTCSNIALSSNANAI